MRSPYPLGVLDQSPIPEGSTGGDALRNSVDLARLADALGYHRYWVAEHHGTPGLACTAPEVLIPVIAQQTTRIRAGSGGIMLPHYSPLKVAECFSMLSGMFPGRIDLGIGRASGTDPATAFALQRDRRQRAPDDFRQQLDELLELVDFPVAAGTKLPRLRILPGRPYAPEPWLLGSSAQSAIWAAELGLPYCFADFINPRGADIARHYRDTFQPSARLAAPRVAVAAWTICAPTDDEAKDLAASFRMLMTLFYRGELIRVPDVETAKAFLTDHAGAAEALGQARRLIIGSPSTVRAGLGALVEEYAADEVLLVNIMYDHAARRRSYELVAREFGLTDFEPAPAPVAPANVT